MRREAVRGCAAVVVFGFSLFGLSARGADAPADKEALRYDGKSFAYWRNYMRTELKADRRIDALRALAAFGVRGHAESAATAIVELVKEYGEDAYSGDAEKGTPDQKVICEATAAIFKIGSVAFEILLQNAKDAHVRRFVKVVYARWDDSLLVLSRSTVRSLLQDMQEDEAELRHFATSMLGNCIERQPASKENALAVLRTEKDTHRLVRGIIKTLDEGKCDGIATVLELLGTRAKPATHTLIKCRLRNVYLPNEVFQAVGTEPETLIPQIIPELKNQQAEIRGSAAKWLGEMGATAKTALPALLQAVQDGPKNVSGSVTDSPGTFESRPSDENAKARLAAIAALGRIGADPHKVVPPLARLVSDEEEAREYRLAAVETLTALGAAAKEATPALLKVFANDDEQDWMRSMALQALEKIGGEPRQVVPHLIHVIEQHMEINPKTNYFGNSNDLNVQSMDYLLKLSPQDKQAKPVLIRALKQYTASERLRPLIAGALGQMGPAARDALPALQEARQSSNAEMRKAAALAIKKITVEEP